MTVPAQTKARLAHAVGNVGTGERGANVPSPSDKLTEKVRAIVAESVAAAVRETFARAPSVHTGQMHDRKEYIDDAIGEVVGPERMERRRQVEADARQERDRPWTMRPEQSRSVYERSDDGDSHRYHSRAHASRNEPGMLVAEYVSWMTRARGNASEAYRMAKQAGASPVMQRALGESVFSTGGAVVPLNIQADFIELLYANSVYLKAGPVRLTVQNGNLVLPKMVAGATANWLGESQNIIPSQQQFGQVRIDLRQLAVITPVSNMFLRDAGIQALEMIRKDLAQAAAITIDAAALRSLGTQYAPTGLRGWVPTSNTFQSSGGTVPLITADIMTALRMLEDAMIQMGKVTIFSSPRTKYGLMSLRDGLNNPVWAEELGRGSWYGAQYFSTQNIPNNVGTGGNKSEIYVVDMSQQIFAEDPAGVRIDVADGPAYFDGSAVVSGFSRDESAVRLIQRCDIVSTRGGKDIVEIYDVAVA